MRDHVVSNLVSLLEEGLLSPSNSIECVLALAQDAELDAMPRAELSEKWSVAKEAYDDRWLLD
jgi:hypothetical protein